MEVLSRVIDGGNVPIGWVENARTDNLCGLHLWLVSGAPIRRLHANGRCVGTAWEDADARYCRIVGLTPSDVAADRDEQTRLILREMGVILVDEGMTFANVIRTWFYNDDILDWYDRFNAARNAFFEEHAVFDGVVPASTGVGGRNALAAALVTGLVAVEPKGNGTQARIVTSPLQSSALDYGSSFSRAVELEFADHRRLYVSGTASIDKAGATVFLGNCRAQVSLTMEVVQAILRSRDMSWGDVTRSLAYFKAAGDAPLFEAHRREHALPRFPAIVVENDICRDDLLFEIEVDALKVR
jgi:enamine deaminase RidA (YjgF/YER057c/UK114 family)